MKLKRNAVIWNVSYYMARLIFGFLDNIKYRGYECIPKRGPALLLAKHQSGLDIILEGMMLYRYAGRKGNWIMKDPLPKILELYGGVGIRRPRDFRARDREQGR